MKRLSINGHEVTYEEFDVIMGEGKARKFLTALRQRLCTVGYAHLQSKTLQGRRVVVYVEDTERLDEIDRFRNGTKRK